MRIVGVNGIRTKGTNNIDRILLEMRDRGFETVDVDLPIAHTWHARWRADDDAELVEDASEDGDVVVAHSYGALRAFHAHQHRDYRAIVCIAPAASRDLEWRHPDRVHCWYSPDDWICKLGALLWFHPFGWAGTKGFEQEGVHNYAIPGLGHNDFFVGARVQWIADHIARLADPGFRSRPAYSRPDGEKGFI